MNDREIEGDLRVAAVLSKFPGAAIVAVHRPARPDHVPGAGKVSFADLFAAAQVEAESATDRARINEARADASDQTPDAERATLRRDAALMRRRAALFGAMTRLIERIGQSGLIKAELARLVRSEAEQVAGDNGAANDSKDGE